MMELIAKLFLGKGLDKKCPILVDLYKKVYSVVAKNSEIEVRIPLSQKLIVSEKDCGLGMMLRTKSVYEPVQTKLFLDVLKPGMTVFDIGANIGYYSVLASKSVGPQGKVYAFEPDPANLKLLEKNLALNNCHNVKLLPYAAGEKNSTATLYLDEANPGESNLGTKSSGKQIKVRQTTLDSFAKERKITQVFKIIGAF